MFPSVESGISNFHYMPKQVIERVHALALEQPEKLVFYDRHGKPICDNTTNIELAEFDTGADNNNPIASHLHESLQSETKEFEQDGIADEEEMSLHSVTHEVEYTGNDDEHGQDQPPDQTNTIDIKESNLVSQTVDSLKRGEQVSDHNIQGEVEHEQHLRRSTRTKVPTRRYKPSMSGKQYNYTTVMETTVHPNKHIWSYYDVDTNGQVVAAILTQLSMKAGIKACGAAARDVQS
jgi:hypothetical protein